MEERKTLDATIAGKHVRILRHWSDKKDRIKPEIYRVTGYVTNGRYFIFKNLLTATDLHVPEHPQEGDPRERDTYLLMTIREVSDYLNECFERSIQDSEFVAQLNSDLTTKRGQLQQAIKRLY